MKFEGLALKEVSELFFGRLNDFVTRASDGDSEMRVLALFIKQPML